MAINLVSLVSQFLTPQLIGSLARAAGINEAIAQRLAAAAIPTILAALGTAAAAPGGAQKIADAVSNSDPDMLSKLSAAIQGGNVGALSEGATALSALIGGSGLSSIAATLSQFAGAPPAAAQPLVGAVTGATIGTIGQQDPSTWSDASSISSFFSSQKDAISAALPPEISKALGATGLLAGLGGIGAAAAQSATGAAQTASAATSSAAREASAAASRAQSAAASAANSAATTAASAGSRFPMWAIVVLIIVVLLAIWWFMSRRHDEAPAPEPQKQGMIAPGVELAALPQLSLRV